LFFLLGPALGQASRGEKDWIFEGESELGSFFLVGYLEFSSSSKGQLSLTKT
jgi:hypothetical protein